MFVSQLRCAQCQAVYSGDMPLQNCLCGGALLVIYDEKAVAACVKPRDIERRAANLWRYRELLPVQDESRIISLGEGMTPLLPLKGAGRAHHMLNLYLKDEGMNPSCTCKARGASVGVSKAGELGIQKAVMSSGGNSAGAWAAYCAKAGISLDVLLDVDSRRLHHWEAAMAGARVFLTDQHFRLGADLARGTSEKQGCLDSSAFREPYRLEGKKTLGFEIAEQLEWSLPDVIVCTVGSGLEFIGLYKGIREMQRVGWIKGKMPRLAAVQADGCAPIVRAWQARRRTSEPWEKPRGYAKEITVAHSPGNPLILDAIYKSFGVAVTVSDEEIRKTQETLPKSEGLLICPEGAASLAAAQRLADEGWIKPRERVVVLNMGAGVKYLEDFSLPANVLDVGRDSNKFIEGGI